MHLHPWAGSLTFILAIMHPISKFPQKTNEPWDNLMENLTRANFRPLAKRGDCPHFIGWVIWLLCWKFQGRKLFKWKIEHGKILSHHSSFNFADNPLSSLLPPMLHHYQPRKFASVWIGCAVLMFGLVFPGHEHCIEKMTMTNCNLSLIPQFCS